MRSPDLQITLPGSTGKAQVFGLLGNTLENRGFPPKSIGKKHDLKKKSRRKR
jgi:hypothetical protein